MNDFSEREALKAKCGYQGKPKQWQYGFDLAIREMSEAARKDHPTLLAEIAELNVITTTQGRRFNDLKDVLRDKDYEIEQLKAQLNQQQTAHDTFQQRVKPWLVACFGEAIARDKAERNHRFLEESLELVQACACTADEAHQLVDYVFSRDDGEPYQEVGGVMVTLAALCLAQGLDMHQNGETELARIWTKVEQIRAKQAAKPKNSPLPQRPAQENSNGN